MPATRSQIRRQKIVDHTVDFGDDVSITFTFDANKITDEWMDRWAEAERDSKVNKLNALLADLILGWDISEEEGGPPIPVSAEEIGKLFTPRDKMRLLDEFAQLPSDAEGNASRNTSSTGSTDSTNGQVPLPTGQPPSETPEQSASRSSPLPT